MTENKVIQENLVVVLKLREIHLYIQTSSETNRSRAFWRAVIGCTQIFKRLISQSYAQQPNFQE